MSNCLRCGVLLKSTNPKARYCGGVCRVMAGRERVAESVVGDGVEWLIGVDGLKRRMSKELVLELMGRYGVVVPSVVVVEKAEPFVDAGAVISEKSLPSAKDGIVAPIVVSKGGGTKSEVLAGLRGIISDVMAKPVDDFVFPDGLDEIKVDYKKLYDGCEFSDEYKALWERIKLDMNLSSKEKVEWKLLLGAR